MAMAAGSIYVLVNSSFPMLVKVGRTERDVAMRAAELSSGSGVPTRFVIAYERGTTDCESAEARVHELLAAHRCSADREFFEISATTAIHVVQSVCAEIDGEAPPASLPNSMTVRNSRAPLPRRMGQRLGPVLARLRVINEQLERWRGYCRDAEALLEHADSERIDLEWRDFEKAAVSASTVSLPAHDVILDIQDPLREVRWLCCTIRERLRSPNYGNPRTSGALQLADQLSGWIEEVLPRTKEVFEQLIVYAPELLGERSHTRISSPDARPNEGAPG
jgi:hypothetical protein